MIGIFFNLSVLCHSGAAPYDKPGAAFAFSVVWRNGISTTVWVAQCMVCDGHEKILTSWLLRSQVDSCVEKWKSTLIGKDTFTRHEQREGPRKKNDTHVPVRPEGSQLRLTRSTGQRKPCNLKGPWYNEVGSEVIFADKDSLGTFTGEYRTAVEREKGSAGTSHSLVYGNSGLGDNPNSTFAMMVVWREGASVTGWVGQCHICGENQTEIVEATWLLKTRVQKCGDNWKSTMFHDNSFTRHEQKAGPRKHLDTHTPNRDGEDESGRGEGFIHTPRLEIVCVTLLLTKILIAATV